MQLVRTTIRLNKQLKKFADGKKEAKKIIFKTHHLGEPLDNLSRDNYYQDPK